MLLCPRWTFSCALLIHRRTSESCLCFLALSWQEENKALQRAVSPLQHRCPHTSKSANWGLAQQPQLLAARQSFATKILHQLLHFCVLLFSSQGPLVYLIWPTVNLQNSSTSHGMIQFWTETSERKGGANIPSMAGFFVWRILGCLS